MNSGNDNSNQATTQQSGHKDKTATPKHTSRVSSLPFHRLCRLNQPVTNSFPSKSEAQVIKVTNTFLLHSIYNNTQHVYSP